MTRIVGGSAGGRRLQTPKGSRTRPTTERVREALFSLLEARVGGLDGLAFLDLYAGSGAVGLEAASRGAARVVLVEQDAKAAGVARANARALGLPAEVRVTSVRRLLATGPGTPFDLVFLDPPYEVGNDQVGSDVLGLVDHGWLAADALVVVERSSRDDPPVWPEVLQPDRPRRYGETALHVAELTGAGPG